MSGEITLSGTGDTFMVRRASTAPVAKYTPVSVNVGHITLGQNNHNGGDPNISAQKMLAQGCRFDRYGAGAPDDATVRAYFASRNAAKLPIYYNVKTAVGAAAMTQIVRTSQANGNVVKCWESLNEQAEQWTVENRFAQLKEMAAGIRAADATVDIAAPAAFGTDGGSGNTWQPTDWNPRFLALNPWSVGMTAFSAHMYPNGAPENGWLNPFMKVADMLKFYAAKFGVKPRMHCTETGYSTGQNSVADITLWYPRLVWLMSGVPFMEVVTYYLAHDDGAGVVGLYGVADSAWNPKPWQASLKAIFDILHTSTARRVYHLPNGVWFVCTDTPAGQYLTGWNTGGASSFDTLNGTASLRLQLSQAVTTVKGTFPEFS